MTTTNNNFKVKNGLDAGGNISTTGNISISLGSDIVGSTLRGSNGQTANLENWQTWNGTTATTVASVSSGGSIYSAGNLGAGSLTALSTARLSVSAAASSIGVIVRGNATTPGNLQEWQTSAPTTVASISSSGALDITSALTTSSTTFNLLNTNGPTINFGGAVGTLNIGTGSFSTLRTINIGSAASGTGNTQTINIGVNSTTTAGNNINIGGSLASTTTVTGTLVAPLGKKVIQTITLSGTSAISFTSIPSTYRDLEIRILATTAVSTSGALTLTVNGLSTNIYSYVQQYVNGVSPSAITYTQGAGATSAVLTPNPFGATASSALQCTLFDYTSSSFKVGNVTFAGGPSSGTYFWGSGNIFPKTTAAITQIDIAVGGTGGITGTAVLIGVY